MRFGKARPALLQKIALSRMRKRRTGGGVRRCVRAGRTNQQGHVAERFKT